MPVPKPEGGESQNDYVGRCMSWANGEHPDMPQEQQLAMCYTTFRGAAKEELRTRIAKDARAVQEACSRYEGMAQTDRVAKATTSFDAAHLHGFEVDSRGDGETGEPVAVGPGTVEPHTHKIKAFQVQSSGGHTHELSRLAKDVHGKRRPKAEEDPGLAAQPYKDFNGCVAHMKAKKGLTDAQAAQVCSVAVAKGLIKK
jgi:hypothetical protein